MPNKPGRPRSSNYHKNLEKRVRQSERKLSQGPDGIYREEIPNKSKELATQVNEKLLTMAKSFLGYVDSPGVAGKYAKSPVYTYEQYQVMTDGVRLRPVWRIDYTMLRQAAMGTSLISAIHTVRVDDLCRFARISKKEGIDFKMDDESQKISPEMEGQMGKFGQFLKFMGDKVEGWTERDQLYPVFEMKLRDTLTVDSIALWIVKNGFGRPIEIKYLDPCTIFPIDATKGYRGDKSIRFVQMVDNTVVEVFGADELLWMHKNHLSDVQLRGWGFAPLEAVMLELVGVINSLKFNRERFTRQPPPGFLSIMGDISQDAIDALEIQWKEMVSGLDDNHSIPIMSSSAGEIKWTPLNLANDMMFKDFMQWLVSFVLIGHGMDQAELGLRLLGSQTLGEANQNDKIKASMTRAKKALLTYFESVYDRIKSFFPEYSMFHVEFAGKDPEDDKEKLAKIKDESSTFKMIDEIRLEQDLPTLGEKMAEMYGVDIEEVKKMGALILNPTYQQYAMSQVQAGQDMNGIGMEGEDGYDDSNQEFVDDQNDEMNSNDEELDFETSGNDLEFEDEGFTDSLEEDTDLKF